MRNKFRTYLEKIWSSLCSLTLKFADIQTNSDNIDDPNYRALCSPWLLG